jgi:hypothetical protein
MAKPVREMDRFPMYARKATDTTRAEKDVWQEFAARHGWNRSEFLRRAANHALTCPLFLPDTSPELTINNNPS